MTDLLVRPAAKPLVGSVPVPSDKSIGHRALLFASIASGRSRIAGFSYGEDNVSTANALRALGVRIDDVSKTSIEVGMLTGNSTRPLRRLPWRSTACAVTMWSS